MQCVCLGGEYRGVLYTRTVHTTLESAVCGIRSQEDGDHCWSFRDIALVVVKAHFAVHQLSCVPVRLLSRWPRAASSPLWSLTLRQCWLKGGPWPVELQVRSSDTGSNRA